MRTYKGQPFTPTQTARPKRRKLKPLRRLDSPDRDKLIRPKAKRPSLPPTGRRNPNRGRNGAGAPGRTGNQTPPVDPLKAKVDALLDLKYGEEQAAIKAEGPVSAQQHTNIQGWYQGYLDDLQTAAQMTSQMYGGAQAATYGQANTAAGQDQARMGENQQQAQASAALRGTSASVQPEQASAIGARQASTTNFGSFLAAQGGAAATLDAGRYSAAGAARVGAHEQESAREAELRAGARKIMAQRAAESVSTRRELEDQDLKRQAFMAEFGLKTQAQKLDAKEARRDDRRQAKDSRSLRRDRARDNRRMRNKDERDWTDKRTDNALNLAKERRMLAEANKPPAGSDGPSKFTPTQIRTNKSNLRKLVALGRSPDPGEKPPSWADPLLLKAAAEIIRYGKVSPQLAKKVRREFGFLPGFRKTKGAVRKFADDISSGPLG